MPSTIPFFPPSLTDETLASRVARYHILAGNRTHATSLCQLFRKVQAGLDQIIPSQLGKLASSLPGDSQVNLQSILAQNTLLPLFSPFIGQNTSKTTSKHEHGASSFITRLPRRVVGKHGDAYLCVKCALEDEQKFGIGYWHRTHQAPGVSTCWKHRTRLINSCPHCRLPFQRKNALLTAPWNKCPQCSFDVMQSQLNESASDVEHRYATFVNELLDLHIAPISADMLAEVYRKRIRAMGFTRGSKPNMVKFEESLAETFGNDFVSQVDPAFSAGRTHTWIRFSTYDGAMDIPLMRHILICMYLFESAANFAQVVHKLHPETRGVTSKFKQDQVPTNVHTMRTNYRNRIRREIKIDPQTKLEHWTTPTTVDIPDL